MKRLIGVIVGLALGIGAWTGSAWAESEPMEATTIVQRWESHDSDRADENPITRVFAGVQGTLDQLASSSPLRSLLNVIAAQLDALEVELAQLYDDLFVETCPTCDSD